MRNGAAVVVFILYLLAASGLILGGGTLGQVFHGMWVSGRVDVSELGFAGLVIVTSLFLSLTGNLLAKVY
jgi:hypothetical protein